jgi:hypothetical protein
MTTKEGSISKTTTFQNNPKQQNGFSINQKWYLISQKLLTAISNHPSNYFPINAEKEISTPHLFKTSIPDLITNGIMNNHFTSCPASGVIGNSNPLVPINQIMQYFTEGSDLQSRECAKLPSRQCFTFKSQNIHHFLVTRESKI